MDITQDDPPPSKKKKRTDLSGWCAATTQDRIRKMSSHPVLGDWRRFGMVKVKSQLASVKWTETTTGNIVTFTTPIPVGMKNVLIKMESQQNRNFKMLPLVIKERFGLKENTYRPQNFDVNVSFASSSEDSDYNTFHYAYCRLCSNKKVLKESYWDKYTDKLPEEVSIANLMQNWDKLSLTWNQQESCGCLIPNDENQSLFINAKLILRPEKHWNSVHAEVVKGSKKTQLQKTIRFLPGATAARSKSSGVSTTTSAASKSASSSSESAQSISIEPEIVEVEVQTSKTPAALTSPPLKPKYRHKKPRNAKVDDMIDPSIHFVGYDPKNNVERIALGNALKMVHLACTTGISDETAIKYHKSSQDTLREYHELQLRGEPPPPRVTLNKNNYHKGVHAVIRAYTTLDQSADNPYRILEKSSCFSMIHDATTYWVKQINTTILRVVTGDDGTIVKVPYNMHKVAGSLTGEVLCEEVMKEICTVRKVENNATKTVRNYLVGSSGQDEIKKLKEELKSATESFDFDEIEELTRKLKVAKERHDSWKDPGGISEQILPDFPHFFNIATIKGFDREKGILHLEINSYDYPVSVCGDSCATNLKAQRLMEELYGIRSPFSNCSSHIASGTVRRTSSSVTMCDENIKRLYNSLLKVLKHFSQSPKSTELLNNALTALEMNNVHMLVWAGTRMCGFLDGCKQCSIILVPFMDTLVTGNIRTEETLFLLCPIGIFLLQLMADLHHIFMNQYLHKTDSDNILVCETKAVAEKTIENLLRVQTPRSDEVMDTLAVDQFDNITVEIKTTNNEILNLTLNTKVTRGKSLQYYKNQMAKAKDDAINCLVDNIRDQVGSCNLMNQFSAFDLSTQDDLDSRLLKIEALYDTYGVDCEKTIEKKWNNLQLTVTYKRKLTCSKDDLITQFKKGYPVMNDMARELRQSKETLNPKSQYQLWQKFVKTGELQFPDYCDLVHIMMAVPPNSAWVERAYSKLEQLCPKRRNRMDIDEHLKDQFFVALLKLPVKKCMDYENEIKILSKTIRVSEEKNQF